MRALRVCYTKSGDATRSLGSATYRSLWTCPRQAGVQHRMCRRQEGVCSMNSAVALDRRTPAIVLGGGAR